MEMYTYLHLPTSFGRCYFGFLFVFCPFIHKLRSGFSFSQSDVSPDD